MVTVSKNSTRPELALTHIGSLSSGQRIRGKLKNRAALTGFAPATACTKYWIVKARPKVIRMPYSTGRSIWPLVIGDRNRRSKMAPIAKAMAQAPSNASSGLMPGSQTAVIQ